MRKLAFMLVGGALLAGCATHRAGTNPVTAGGKDPPGAGAVGGSGTKLLVTPETGLIGKVVRVNENAQFAVLNFPVGTMPGVAQRLNVYRHGLKVGEVRVTGPRQDDNTVADIVNGEVQVGDELRTN